MNQARDLDWEWFAMQESIPVETNQQRASSAWYRKDSEFWRTHCYIEMANGRSVIGEIVWSLRGWGAGPEEIERTAGKAKEHYREYRRREQVIVSWAWRNPYQGGESE